MAVSIWYRYEGKRPEKIDSASSQREADRLAGEYTMAFGCGPRQHRHGKDNVWAGRRDQEPGREVESGGRSGGRQLLADKKKSWQAWLVSM
jgi:hypothetical protein